MSEILSKSPPGSTRIRVRVVVDQASEKFCLKGVTWIVSRCTGLLNVAQYLPVLFSALTLNFN